MANVLLTIKKGKHATQPFTYDINKPGPAKGETKKVRYTRSSDSERGGLRALGAEYNDEYGYWECQIKGQWYRIKIVHAWK